MSRLVTLFALLTVFCARPALAVSVDALVSDGKLAIDASISRDGGTVPGQKLQLTLTVSTDTWFTGGTRITVPEVPGLVILQNEQFAANASENRDGKTWVVQRWSLDVFPQRAGDFSIGPVKLRVAVNGGSAGNVAGVLESRPVSFRVVLPESLKDVEQWLAAPSFRARQDFDRSLDDLVVGDAIEQTVVFQASDIMAMMLPAFEPAQQAGLRAYPEPAQLDNNINRGALEASRKAVISYVTEAPGDFVLPRQDFFWWDTTRQTLEVVSLPETRFTVGGTAAASTTPDTAGELPVRTIAALVILAVIAVIARMVYRLLPWPRIATALRTARDTLIALRRPALPERLNPGSSAGD